ncbi:hypothetical protein [Evansella cellulosilytica]|uniref:Ferric oxidoreductase domain-containing protein n=1 Tax=Evansella cellulosilytica (strain ATCC 21833 / DSM 2522 / FERM P-1141 / JCM 9156 / N-4) TaxID=649639 RepID=E6TXX7_EVAC2|nr:hypothetical protein [Evansella cellulosilytica]ADU31190.1 hypothetical protein Bcell_2939 [Evansella cellulosilytica DSM 2522]
MNYNVVMLSGVFALLLFFCNISIYFLFLSIRKCKKRSLQIFLAKLARKWMRIHQPVAYLIFTVILIHFLLTLMHHYQFTSKTIAGLLAAIILVILLISGFIRQRRANKKRKLFHRTMAFLCLFFIMIHVLV